ncbi:hypothetical protein [Clostridium frigidicarnis]|uniref:Uncharacterized protein n=1 Tax=Clostridium frigidicarnis TaxID=84698 RepID=A0A1I0VY29_9CLOT|nr:hypothetical protein [Clostridium frigidicarnis]SFA81184.1 hypothetical protein SAMN04488528_1003112 [Clostridium frigidicarnis]
MGTRQKKLLSVFLTVSSIMGIVAPGINANATPIEDESNATAEELKEVIKEYSEKLAEKPNFANHHRVNYAAERLEKYDAEAAARAKEFIAQYDNQVFTKEVVEVITKMDTFSTTKNMQLFDDLLNIDIPALEKIDVESADYLKSRLDVWGQAVVFDADPNYVKATDEIIKVQTLREEGKLEEASTQVGTAKEAIGKIATLELNGPYLEAKLKVQEDLVNEEIAKQDLYVRNVEADNAREIIVTFNRDITSHTGENADNFEITAANSDAKDVSIVAAELNDDRSVLLTVSGLNNNENAKYLVKVKNVATKEETEMKDYGEILNLYDNTAPKVKSVGYSESDKELTVKFTEPIMNKADYPNTIKLKSDGATIYINKDQFTKKAAKCIINVDSLNLKEDKKYSIEVDGLTDFAGNALTKYVGEIEIKKDNEDPTLNGIDVLSKNVFKVSFNEAIKNNDFKVLVDGKENAAELIDTNEDDYEYEFKLLDVPENFEGNKIITIYGYEDVSGNKGDSVTKEVKFEAKHPALDIDSPDAEIKIFGELRYAVFTFDRDLKNDKGNDIKIEVKHEDKDGITITDNVSLLYNGTLEDIDANQIALDITNLDQGKYRFDLESSDIIDKYDQKIEKTSLTFNNNTSGKTARVTSVQPNDQKKDEDKVIVKFDTDLGADAKEPSNYTIDGVQVFESAIFKEDKKTVELTLKEGWITTTGNKTFRVNGLKNVKSYEEVLEFQENVKPEISKAEVVSYNKIKLSMSDVISSEYTIDKNDLKVRVNDTSVQGDIVVTGQGTDTLMITLSPEDKLRNSDDKVTIEVLEDNTISDLYGNTVKSGLIGNVEVKLDSLFDTASAEVDKLKDQCDKLIDDKITDSKDVLKAAEDQLVKANNAVKELDENSVDRNKLQDRIKTEENRINVFKTKVAINDLKLACDKLTDPVVTEPFADAEAKLKIVDANIKVLKDASVDTTKLEEDRKVQSDRIEEFEVKVAKNELVVGNLIIETVESKEQVTKIKDHSNGATYVYSVSENSSLATVDDKGNIQIVRPIDKDSVEIEITVTISKGNNTDTKKFTLTIPKDISNPIIIV